MEYIDRQIAAKLGFSEESQEHCWVEFLYESARVNTKGESVRRICLGNLYMCLHIEPSR